MPKIKKEEIEKEIEESEEEVEEAEIEASADDEEIEEEADEVDEKLKKVAKKKGLKPVDITEGIEKPKPSASNKDWTDYFSKLDAKLDKILASKKSEKKEKEADIPIIKKEIEKRDKWLVEL